MGIEEREAYLSTQVLGKVMQYNATVLDPLLRDKQSEYLIDQENNTAYIEVANTSGLQMLQVSDRDPFLASSIVS